MRKSLQTLSYNGLTSFESLLRLGTVCGCVSGSFSGFLSHQLTLLLYDCSAVKYVISHIELIKFEPSSSNRRSCCALSGSALRSHVVVCCVCLHSKLVHDALVQRRPAGWKVRWQDSSTLLFARFNTLHLDVALQIFFSIEMAVHADTRPRIST